MSSFSEVHLRHIALARSPEEPQFSLALLKLVIELRHDRRASLQDAMARALGPTLGGWSHLPAIALMLLAGAGAGGLWGGAAGWLRARRDVNEVIATIMMNFVAAQVLSWLVHGPLMEASRAYPMSGSIAQAAELRLYFPPSRLNLAMLLAVVIAAGRWPVERLGRMPPPRRNERELSAGRQIQTSKHLLDGWLLRRCHSYFFLAVRERTIVPAPFLSTRTRSEVPR